MTRFCSLLLFSALLVPLTAQAQTPYAISWPADDPIWELEVLSPERSAGPNGSGLEIRNVTFNGRSVMKYGGVPILNVKYEEGCNCFRDWQDSEVRFVADNPINPSWVAEATPGTVATMCDVAPDNCVDTNGDGEADSCNDVGGFEGVAVERFETFLRLTTHMRAGWYRYTMRWEFHEDGLIRPLFGFTSTGSACTQNPRRHHAYWRFDFDIDGADNDYVVESTLDHRTRTLDVETTSLWSPALRDRDPSGEIRQPMEVGVDAWHVYDEASARGYALIPSPADLLTPANPETGDPNLDNFAKEDFVVTRYNPGEIDDGAFGCSAKFTSDDTNNPIVDGENVLNTDVVVWYRSGITKPDIDPGHCYESGPLLKPIGDWSTPENLTTSGEQEAQPAGFTLDEAYPNPFDRTTTVRFTVEEVQPVTLTLYDGLGRAVRTLYEGTPAAGVAETVVIDGSALPSGTYTVRLEGRSVQGSTRVVLLK
jgi:hypothetical protein